jgi:glycosyltransferase involved in cell wall biosynthesis
VKVLHLIQRYPPAVGGSETWCQQVCQQLAAAGDEMKVLTFDVIEEEEFWRDPPVDRCTVRLGRLAWDKRVLVRRYKRSLPVHALYHSLLKVVLDRWLGIYFYGPHSIEMYGHLVSEVLAADVVYLHTLPYPHNFAGYVAARLCGKPVVITPHFHPGHPHYERWSNYWLLKRCDAVVVISDYEREYLAAKGVEASRILATGTGVHLDEYRPTDRARFDARLRTAHGLSERTRPILFLGRKLEYKGIATLVEAFKRLPRHLDTALLLAGPSSPWFDDFYRGLPATDRARIIDLGVVSHPDKVHLLHLAHILVLPSRFEAFGIVILEAWACNTPVIVAKTGAMPSIVADGGFVFEHGDAADLAGKMKRLLEDAELGSGMARRGHQRLLERYTWDMIAPAVRKTYRPLAAKARRRRVLICSNLFPPYGSGGAEIVAHQEASVLEELGVDVQVFCGRLHTTADHPYRVRTTDGAVKKTWVRLSPVDISGQSWNFRNDCVRQRFASVLDRFAPDVVHFHNLLGLSVTMADECEARGIPTVLTLHDYWGICFKNTMLKNDGALCARGGFDCMGCLATLWGESSIPSPVRNAHILLSLAKVDRFISPSQYLADRYAANGIPRDRILVMRNGIDLERFENAHPQHDTFTVGFIGYLGRHKGLDVLLRALSLLPGSTDVRLLVVGDGEERENLQALCRSLRLDRLVTFRGRVDNQRIGTIYERIDALVVPSVWPENSPVTITEAMASGIPVIASDIGGVKELVEDGVTGLLAPARDASALAERIERLRTEPALRKTMGQNARARIARDGLKGQVTRLIEIFDALSAQTRMKSGPDFDIVLYASAQQPERPVLDMLHQLARLETKLGTRLLACRMDLCDEHTLRSAKLLVLPTTDDASLLHCLQALRRRVPLLVPEADKELAELCRQSNAGLAYADGDELYECLETLLTDEALRSGLGANGHDFVIEQATQACARS